jgi:hypothetical protein
VNHVLRGWWTGEDSNLRSPQGAADLQSAGFSHSPTRPHGKLPKETSVSRFIKRHPLIWVYSAGNRLFLFLEILYGNSPPQSIPKSAGGGI